MKKTQNSSFKLLIGVLILVIVMAGLWVAYRFLSPDTAGGEKIVTVEITLPGEAPKEYIITTEAEFLGDALIEKNLIAGEQGAYGLYVKEVCGAAADESKQEFWLFSKSGEPLATGVDTTPIADGDHFEIGIDTW